MFWFTRWTGKKVNNAYVLTQEVARSSLTTPQGWDHKKKNQTTFPAIRTHQESLSLSSWKHARNAKHRVRSKDIRWWIMFMTSSHLTIKRRTSSLRGCISPKSKSRFFILLYWRGPKVRDDSRLVIRLWFRFLRWWGHFAASPETKKNFFKFNIRILRVYDDSFI